MNNIPEEIKFIKELGYEIPEQAYPQCNISIMKESSKLATYTGNKILFTEHPLKKSIKELWDISVLRKELRKRGIECGYACSACHSVEERTELRDETIREHLKEIADNYNTSITCHNKTIEPVKRPHRS